MVTLVTSANVETGRSREQTSAIKQSRMDQPPNLHDSTRHAVTSKHLWKWPKALRPAADQYVHPVCKGTQAGHHAEAPGHLGEGVQKLRRRNVCRTRTRGARGRHGPPV